MPGGARFGWTPRSFLRPYQLSFWEGASARDADEDQASGRREQLRATGAISVLVTKASGAERPPTGEAE